ncbi:MAG: RNA methyltransferase [Bacteroidales bacterium]
MYIDEITSVKNPKIKNLLLLEEKSKARREQKLFVVEGRRETLNCLAGGYIPIEVFFLIEKYSESDLEEIFHEDIVRACAHFFQVDKKLYAKLAYRGSTEGIVAVFKSKDNTLADLKLPENPLVLVLEGVEKPGNLGAVIRTAEAAACDAVIFCDVKTDIYNPNLIRSSIGGIFNISFAVSTTNEAISWLKEHNINILTAQLQNSELYYETDMKVATAIVIGTEDKGLTDNWRKASDKKIHIPMNGQLDSLNVSVSAAILCYEAVRQRYL